jgi:hypothetical protein
MAFIPLPEGRHFHQKLQSEREGKFKIIHTDEAQDKVCFEKFT